MDTHFRDTLLPVTAGLSGIFVLFVVGNYATLPAPVGLVSASVNLGLALVFFLAHLGLRVWGLDARAAHPVGVGLALVVLLATLLPFYWTQEPVLTSYLILIQLGAAMFFLDWRSLAVVVALTDVAWYVAYLRAGYSFEWAIFGLSLVTATILAGLAHGVRMRVHRSYAALHIADQRRSRELELAADVAAQSERRFRSLVEATSEGIVIVDEGRVIDHNPAFTRMFGWPYEEVAGHRLAEFLTPESMTRLDQVKFSGTGPPLHVTGVRRDGSRLPLQVVVKLAPFQGRFVSLLAIRDLPSASGVYVDVPRPFHVRRR